MMKTTNLLPKFAPTLGASMVFAMAGQAAVFDLGQRFTSAFGITEVRGSLVSTQTGVFTSEAEIEAFLNHSAYALTVYDGDAAVYTVSNANSWWDLEFDALHPEGPAPAATVVSSRTGLILDFSTPGEVSSVMLLLRSDPFGFMFGMQQHNNISDTTFLWADNHAIRLADTELPYDSPVTFGAIPEPRGLLLFAGCSAAWCMARRMIRGGGRLLERVKSLNAPLTSSTRQL